MSISMRLLQNDMDECASNTTISLNALDKLHRSSGVPSDSDISQRPEMVSLRSLGHRHNHELKFLWLNTYLIPGLEVDVAGIYEGNVWTGAPARYARAKEISAAILEGNYDVAALCEVFNDESKDWIVSACGNPAWVIGPWEGTWKAEAYVPGVSEIADWAGFGDGRPDLFEVWIGSSGLLTVLPGRYRLIGDAREKFNNQGDKKRDADAWSNKGIALTVVETGYNTKFEFYSTHLFNGGDLYDISDQDRISIQVEQVDQLVSFIQRNHVPNNFIVVAGDFNIDASTSYYEHLRSRMEDICGLEDVWTRYAQQKYKAYLGRTSEPSACLPDRGTVCERFADDGIDGAIDDSGRIDYIFVQKPYSSHDISIEISRPRRIPFPREQTATMYNEIQYLSDHLGIEMKLYFSSKH